MKLFSPPLSFQTGFLATLSHFLELPSPTAEQLLIVTTHAIVLHDHNLMEQARKTITPRLQDLNPADTSEDYQVLRKILAAPDPFALIHQRTTPAGFQVQYNEIRTFRPRRESSVTHASIHQPYDASKFNFTRIPGVMYAKDDSTGCTLAFYYNKYPFAPYHTSIVPDPSDSHEQFLTARYHQAAWSFLQHFAKSQPNIVLAYNSLGAYASINHLHFQMIADGHHLPLLNTPNLALYPVTIGQYHNPDTAWEHINKLQAAGQTFNLIYTPDRILVIERKPQGSYQEPNWTTGFAWYELSGGIITTSKEAYQTITDHDIKSALQAATYAPKVLSA